MIDIGRTVIMEMANMPVRKLTYGKVIENVERDYCGNERVKVQWEDGVISTVPEFWVGTFSFEEKSEATPINKEFEAIREKAKRLEKDGAVSVLIYLPALYNLLAEIDRLQDERDTLLKDALSDDFKDCPTCIHENEIEDEYEFKSCKTPLCCGLNWQWRGIERGTGNE